MWMLARALGFRGGLSAGGGLCQDAPVQRPLPQPDGLTQPFWDAVNAGRLEIQRCGGCARWHHPPVAICAGCLSTELVWERVSGRGRVHSWTIARDTRLAAFTERLPYALASVELEEDPGVLLLTNLPGAALDQIRIGMPVEVEFEEIAPGQHIPQFRPAP